MSNQAIVITSKLTLRLLKRHPMFLQKTIYTLVDGDYNNDDDGGEDNDKRQGTERNTIVT